jgi:hypothetical protein
MDRPPMELTYECRDCQAVNRVSGVEAASTLTCQGCRRVRDVAPGSLSGGTLEACAVCATEDLYIQKDFPHVLGLSIVMAGFALSTVFYYDYRPVAALVVLMATAALDLLLYYLVPDVTICYRCLSQYRGRGSNSGSRFFPFDLAIGERYRQERLRIEELRQRRESADAVPPV